MLWMLIFFIMDKMNACFKFQVLIRLCPQRKGKMHIVQGREMEVHGAIAYPLHTSLRYLCKAVSKNARFLNQEMKHCKKEADSRTWNSNLTESCVLMVTPVPLGNILSPSAVVWLHPFTNTPLECLERGRSQRHFMLKCPIRFHWTFRLCRTFKTSVIVWCGEAWDCNNNVNLWNKKKKTVEHYLIP